MVPVARACASMRRGVNTAITTSRLEIGHDRHEARSRFDDAPGLRARERSGCLSGCTSVGGNAARSGRQNWRATVVHPARIFRIQGVRVLTWLNLEAARKVTGQPDARREDLAAISVAFAEALVAHNARKPSSARTIHQPSEGFLNA